MLSSYWYQYYSVVGSPSLCVIANQVDGNNVVEIVEIKLIWVHHVADNEYVTTGYIYQAKKKIRE